LQLIRGAQDYLKYDNCYNQGQSGTALITFNRYKTMSQALNETGKAVPSLPRPKSLSLKTKVQVARSSTQCATGAKTPPGTGPRRWPTAGGSPATCTTPSPAPTPPAPAPPTTAPSPASTAPSPTSSPRPRRCRPNRSRARGTISTCWRSATAA